jgi:hypothetical protein
MPRGTKSAYDTTKWNTYEAIIDNLHFEWEDHMDVGEESCKEECLEYLQTYFPVFTLREFYLKKDK